MSFPTNKTIRITLLVLGIVSAIFAPPLVSLIILALLSFIAHPLEILLLGVFVDFLWAPVSPLTLPFFTFAALLLAWGVEPLRREFIAR